MRNLKKIEVLFRRLVFRLPKRTQLILICILIGIVAGISAFFLKSMLQYVHYLIHLFQNKIISVTIQSLLPIFGLLLTTLYISAFHSSGFPKGIGPILLAIKKNGSRIEKSQMYGHIISSALTIGFGGSVGLEAPIVATGSAIGSNIAHYFRISREHRTLLLASGAAAGISAIFNAPIAGVLFAIEVLLVEISVQSFIPLLLASATAAIVAKILYQGQLFVLITNEWKLQAIPFYLVLGVLAGLFSVFIIRQTIKTNKLFEKIQNKWFRAMTGGGCLAIAIFLFPPLFGEGYFSIQGILNSQMITAVNENILKLPGNTMLIGVILLLFIKLYATSVTISSGGNGGIFAPSLFMGGILGFFLSSICNSTNLIELNVVNFTVVGMASVLSGVIKIPLTSVFLIAEITGGYKLLIPLMLVSAVSYYISSHFEHKSIYTKELDIIV